MTKFKSGFALLDVTTGRAVMAKRCIEHHRTPVTIRGYITAGSGGVGKDDGVSREFAVDVEKVEFGEPEYIPGDTAGRPWARLGALKAGDMVELDDGFTCSPKKRQRVREDAGASGGLYVKCADGRHYLAGQLDFKDSDALIGVYKA